MPLNRHFSPFFTYPTVKNRIILVIPICKAIFSYHEIFFIYFKIYWYKLSDSETVVGTLTVAEPLILKNVDYNVIFLSNF